MTESGPERREIDLYRRTAQELLEYDAEIYAEYGNTKPNAVWLAQLLYEKHGPFELDWYTWAREPEDWYDYE